jgi:hypothetical protein
MRKQVRVWARELCPCHRRRPGTVSLDGQTQTASIFTTSCHVGEVPTNLGPHILPATYLVCGYQWPLVALFQCILLTVQPYEIIYA